MEENGNAQIGIHAVVGLIAGYDIGKKFLAFYQASVTFKRLKISNNKSQCSIDRVMTVQWVLQQVLEVISVSWLPQNRTIHRYRVTNKTSQCRTTTPPIPIYPLSACPGIHCRPNSSISQNFHYLSLSSTTTISNVQVILFLITLLFNNSLPSYPISFRNSMHTQQVKSGSACLSTFWLVVFIC